MKKIGGYIMLLLVLANLFAPLSVNLTNNNKNIIQKNTVNAASNLDTCNETSDYCFTLDTIQQTDKGIGSNLYLKYKTTALNVLVVRILDKDKKIVVNNNTVYVLSNFLKDDRVLKLNYPGGMIASGSVVFTGLTPNTQYTLQVDAAQLPSGDPDVQKFLNNLVSTDPFFTKTNLDFLSVSKDAKYSQSKGIDFTTNAAGDNKIKQNEGNLALGSPATDSIMPACSMVGTITLGIVNSEGTFMGCIAQGLYYVIFVPTSYVFAIAGKFFDWTFMYSISDNSYRATFVIEGWKIVRDLCNIFFIFVLLTAAIKMILDIGHGAKDAIINVIVIGLLINFSLFTTQIIIDSSNILARLFYNSDAIKITMMKNGAGAENFNQAGVNMYSDSISSTGEIPISAAIVDKVNPQSIIINAKQITVSDPANLNNPNGTESKNGVGIGTFILVTLLSSAVNIIGFFIFLSIGLMFVARVIGLWFAMILVPLAFFSYTMPHILDDMDYVGWKKWWPETLKLAFMAPVFMFFMYLILIFLDNSFLDLTHATSQTGLNFVLSIILPFAFIIMLLSQAKSVAKTMSGKIGGMITNYTTAAGGMILGGAALGTAMLGRQTLGAVSKYAQNDGARSNALSFKSTQDAVGKIKGWNTLNPFAYAKVATTAVRGIGQAAAAGVGAGVSQIGRKTDASGKTTSLYQRKSAEIKDKNHAIHALDEKAQAITHDKNTKYKDLDETDKEKVKDAINKDVVAKGMGYNANYDKLKKPEKDIVDAEVNTNHAGNWENAAHTLNPKAHSAGHMEESTKLDATMSEFINSLRRGSYDVRNMSKMSTQSKGLAGFIVNTSSVLAAGMRSGLKDTVGISHGNGNKDFMKDMKEVLTEAFKTAKLEVKIPSSGGHGGGHDDHGGGHDDHGGGGHH